jgi:Protein of unknown function (DUF2950)
MAVAVEAWVVAEEVAVTGSRTCCATRFLQKKDGMEASRIMGIKNGLQKIRWGNLVKFAPAVFFGMWSVGFAWILWAEPAGQKTFSSPEEASKALFRAVQAGNDRDLLEIFGADGKEILFSGDKVEDRKSREMFAEKYQRMNRLVKEPDGTVRLYVGAENWPMPIPLVDRKDAWYFDTNAGKDEILFRRIGRNEMAAIRVLRELVAAQKEYYSKTHDDDVKQYAQKFVSDQGKHNGLYWSASNRETESPIGPLVAFASSEGYGKKLSSLPSPFRGYYFRVLTRQGKHASGGAKNFIVNDKMTRGFAFLAYPAEHANSGMMSFIVDQDGILYQKDLGPKTAELASALREYDPDKTWARVE